MSVANIIDQALQQDVLLYLNDKGELAFKAANGLSEQLKTEIIANKKQIVTHLSLLKSASKPISAQLPPIRKIPSENRGILSRAQQRLLFLDQQNEGSAEYNIQGVFEVEGKFNKSAFYSTIEAIIGRHHILSTNYQTVDGQVKTVLNLEHKTPVVEMTRRDNSLKSIEEELNSIISDDRNKSFNLSEDCLLRVTLFRVSSTRHFVIFNMHHIASDGWSVGVIKQEFNKLYSAFALGNTPCLQTLPYQYSDYVHWQAELLTSPLYTQGLKFWQSTLSGLSPYTDFPVDKKRPEVMTHGSVCAETIIDKTILNKIEEICQSNNVTLYMFLETAFAVLLGRFCDSNDIVVGTPVSGREKSELEPLIGLFINTVVLRTDLSDKYQNFTDLLSHNKNTIIEAFANQFVPFEDIVGTLNHERRNNINPIFQSWFVLQNNEKIELALDDCQIKPYSSDDSISAKYDVNLYASQNNNGLHFDWVLNEDIFVESTAQFLAKEFEAFLIELADDPAKLVSQYTLFEITNDNYSGHVDVDLPFNVIQMLGKQAEKHTNKTAVVFQDHSITYAELDELSDAYAAKLASLEEVQRVALIQEKGIEIIIAMWACLKADKIYVPIDTSFPTQRIVDILEDAQIQLIVNDLSNHSNAEVYCRKLGVESLLIDKDLPPKAYDKCSSSTTGKNWNAGYILYTSGSMGKPKGVLQNINGLSYHAKQYADLLDLNSNDKILQLASFSFDASIPDMFGSIISGATLYLTDIKHVLQSQILDEIQEKEISVYHSTATVFNAIFGDFKGYKIENIRKVVIGGEAVSDSTISLFDRISPASADLINLYGATESTLISTQKVCRQERVVNLGQAIPGMRIELINNEKSKCKAYEVGELVIQSAFLAQGYWNKDVLTEERFSNCIEATTKGPNVPYLSTLLPIRKYHTGDLGYVCSQGLLRWVGRKDQQIKFNGIRIEPSEIEAHVKRIEKLKSAAAIKHYDANSDQHSLVVFFTADQSNMNVEGWRDKLKKYLPTFMVPNQFIQLDELPQTASGKINRLVLSKMAIVKEIKSTNIAARNPNEQKLSQLWSDIFGVSCVSIDDSFFELGGHSIGAMNLLAKVSKEFNVAVSLKDFFINPSIRALAELVQNAQPAKTNELDSLLTVRSNEWYESFPLNNIQHAYWLGRAGIFELGGVSTQSYVEFEIPDLNRELLEKAINQTVKRHDMLRMVLNRDGSQQIFAETPYYSLAYYSLVGKSEEHQNEHFANVQRQMFERMQSLEQWPNFDIRITQFTNEKTKVHLCTDAIYMDARSKQIFLQDIAKLYHSPESALPNLNVSFRDYVLAEEKLKDTALFESSKQYWLARIDALPLSPELPLAGQLGKTKSLQFKQRAINLSKEQWRQLQKIAQLNQVTITNVLLTLYSDVLALWSKNKHFTINVTAFNRLPLHEDIENVIGDFTSSSLLEVNHNHVFAFNDRVTNIQNQLLQDLEYRYFTGIEVLREKSARDGKRVIMPIVFTSLIGMGTEKHIHENPFFAQIAQSMKSYSQTSQVLLDCQITEVGEGAKINWNSVDALFPANLVQEMFEQFERSINQMLTDEYFWSDTKRSVLPPPQDERRRMVNNTSVDRPTQLLHQPFEQMTELFAHKTAIVSGNIEITYQQLEWMSNAIAAKLKQNELVAVVMEKGWEQIAAVLGILKAGAAYLPIDANLPVQRIHSLLEIGDVQSVLCQQHTKECVDELISVQSIEIGSEYLGVAPHQRVNSILADTDLAYVIFTSGSTGIPKGVMIDHRGAINTIFDINNRFSITENDTVLALSALNFDLSVYDIFGILGVGGKIVLPPADKVNDAEVWSELVNIHKVTVWNSVPALMQMWIDTVCDRQLIIESPLRTVMMSGDWIPLDLPTRIQKMFDGVNIYSLGGATEASIWSIYYPIERVEDKWTSIPYGKPMENQTFNVLKSDLSECPEQVVGDLYIGGIGLAKGYFKDPEKTKVSFIKHPNTGEILYRTGDMGRYLADGNIEFLGREDAQVKVNGYRIELGEIESIVKQHELVKHVVVNAFGEKFDKKLIAYLVLSNNNISFDKVKEDITQLISGALPHYMIPAGFIAIDNIPLTANGKVNRDELPVPDLMQEQADDIVYSENETERKLCAIWSETLGLEVQNVESDFFLLGGDSLQAAKIISAIRNEFDLDSDKFQITTFFEKPTIKAIAENIIAYKRIEKLNDGLLNLTEADEEIEEGMI